MLSPCRAEHLACHVSETFLHHSAVDPHRWARIVSADFFSFLWWRPAGLFCKSVCIAVRPTGQILPFGYGSCVSIQSGSGAVSRAWFVQPLLDEGGGGWPPALGRAPIHTEGPVKKGGALSCGLRSLLRPPPPPPLGTGPLRTGPWERRRAAGF